MERRLVAILAADIVGYSALMEADETGTRQRQKDIHAQVIDPQIAASGGRLVKLMGDGLLVEFASVVDAVRCAVNLQEQMIDHEADAPPDRRIAFRIGINLGDVIHEDGDLFGDGVNIAARLEQMADPGGICISGTVYDHLKSNVDAEYVALGNVSVKNIAHPVRAYRVVDGSSARPRPKTVGKTRNILIAVAALCVALVFWVWFQSTSGPTGAEPVSVAVIPFTNNASDADQDYFVNGITEDITTDLSKVAGLTVTSYSATQRFRGKSLPPTEIASQLGVNHILEGSIRRAGDDVRITARLIDATTGAQLWADRYDRKTSDIFAIQDDIAERIVSQISTSLHRSARTYTPKVAAYDDYIKGRAQRIPPTPPNLTAALDSFNRAIAADPQFAGGYAGASFATLLLASESYGSPEQTRAMLERAHGLAQQAVDLDPGFGPAWGSLAEVKFRQRDFDAALEAVNKAVALAPSDSLMRARLGRFLGHMGRAPEGIEQVRIAMRMSPDSLPMLYFLGANLRADGQYDAAIDALLEHRTRLNGRILPGPTSQLIAALVQSGDRAGATKEAQALLAVAPAFTAAHAALTHPYQDPQEAQEFAAALVAAGLKP